MKTAYEEGVKSGLRMAGIFATRFADCSYYQSGKAVNLSHEAHSDAHDACHVAIEIVYLINRALACLEEVK